MDVHNTFLYGDLDKDVYMKPLLEFAPLSPYVACKLKNSLYDL